MSELTFMNTQYDKFVFKNSNWQLSKENGFHIGHGASDYYAQWFNETDNKWRLYIRGYESSWVKEKKLIITVDTIHDVFKYMIENKHPKE